MDANVSLVLESMRTFLRKELDSSSCNVDVLIEKFKTTEMPAVFEMDIKNKFVASTERMWRVTQEQALDVWMFWKNTEQTKVWKYQNQYHMDTESQIVPSSLLYHAFVHESLDSTLFGGSTEKMIETVDRWKKNQAARVIQKTWRHVIADPKCLPCKNMLMREFAALCTESTF